MAHGRSPRREAAGPGIMAAGGFDPSAAVARPSRGDPAIHTDPTSSRSFDPAGDRAIVEAVLAGDRDAFRRIVERESATVIATCHRILGDRGEAEDAAQEAFVTAYRSLASWRGDGPLGAWLSRIAVRIALRMAARRRTVAWRDPFGGEATPGAADRSAERAAIAAAPTTDPAILAMRAERATEIRSAVIGLPEPYREVVALRFFADASLDDIARQTGRPLGTVKTHLHRGLARLRDGMAGSEPR